MCLQLSTPCEVLVWDLYLMVPFPYALVPYQGIQVQPWLIFWSDKMSLIFIPLKCCKKLQWVFTAPKFSQVIMILLPYQVSDLILHHFRTEYTASYWLIVNLYLVKWCKFLYVCWMYVCMLQMVLVLDVTTRWPSSSSIWHHRLVHNEWHHRLYNM